MYIRKPGIIRPSYRQGFARSAEESKYPDQWNELAGAWNPSLGVTGKTLHGLSSNKNDGVIGGAAWASGRDGPALRFVGNDYVNCGNDESLNIIGNITVKAWVKLTGFPVTYSTVVERANSGLYKGYTLIVEERKVQFYIGDGVDWQGVTNATTVLQDNVWYNIAGVYDGQIHVFVNGIEEGTPVNQSSPGSLVGQNCYIGTSSVDFPTGRPFNGFVELVKVYNRACSSGELWNSYLDPSAMFQRRRVWYYYNPTTAIIPDPASCVFTGVDPTVAIDTYANLYKSQILSLKDSHQVKSLKDSGQVLSLKEGGQIKWLQ